MIEIIIMAVAQLHTDAKRGFKNTRKKSVQPH